MIEKDLNELRNGNMKSIIQSIRPEWVAKILNGEKTIEVRKRYIEPPFKVYIYCTKGKGSLVYSKDSDDVAWCKPFVDKENNRVWTVHNEFLRKNCKSREWNGKVVAEFVCDKVDEIIYTGGSYDVKGESKAYTNQVASKSCLKFPDLRDYLGAKTGYGLHITDLKIYDKPKELGKFHRFCGNDGDGCPDDDCPYYETPSYEYGEVDYDCQSLRPVERPPQDFMYVEELK